MVGRLGLLLLILLSGCASLTPEEKTLRSEEREWKNQIDMENWIMCDSIGGIFVHYDHEHPTWGRPNRRVSRWDIKSDLSANLCHAKLKGYWIHY